MIVILLICCAGGGGWILEKLYIAAYKANAKRKLKTKADFNKEVEKIEKVDI